MHKSLKTKWFSPYLKELNWGGHLDDQGLHDILAATDILFDQGKPRVSVGHKAIGPSRRRQPVAKQKPSTVKDFAYSLEKYTEKPPEDGLFFTYFGRIVRY